MQPLLLMTRPKVASEAFVAALPDDVVRQIEICTSPLIVIHPSNELPDLAPYSVLVFTSANGVSAFEHAGGVFLGTCLCVGDNTAQAAERIGLKAVSASGDADRLIDKAITMGLAGKALHLRGEHTRGEVAARLTSAGLPTDEAVIYSQDIQDLNPAAKAALSQDRAVLVPLFSPRTARKFVESTDRSTNVTVLAISDAVASEIPPSHVGSVHVVTAPNRRAMVDGVEAWVANASLV